jgi:hypothetical protein
LVNKRFLFSTVVVFMGNRRQTSFIKNARKLPFYFNFFVALSLLSGCYSVGLDRKYTGPPTRPAEIEAYYSKGESYRKYTSEVVSKKDGFTINRYTILSHLAPITVDFYERPEKSDQLILVFPVLGGKNIIADYFARHFAQRGFDTAVVHRNNAFKNPLNFDRLEDIFREDIVRDRIVLDFFEGEIGKKEFGSFGISRGGINVAVTAGVDARLKHNVITLGGTDIVQLFRNSSQGRLQKYTDTVLSEKKIDHEEFYRLLEERIKTDPKNLAQYMDAKDTLLILGLFDTTVPFKYGQQLRAQIGNPKTVYLFADHFVGLLYTQFLHMFVPVLGHTVIPLDYIETEAYDFYVRSFGVDPSGSKSLFFRGVLAPLDLAGQVFDFFFVSDQPAYGPIN